ncbi:cobyrinate a,c-diamide synthase, partial [Desulfovibrio sp. OttesenSCG-928-G15]|nr:cobyrinate a,c-diamide synthase [Desulfovibrio sp. OttesenSCG-928-G15]
MHAMTSPVPRLVVAGTNSGSGKTTLSLALLAAFARKGLRVFPFKCGPDYIDPAFLQAAAGTGCINLDAWLMPEEVLAQSFLRRMREAADAPGAPLALIEGVMGYFDGLDRSSRCSTAHIAQCLDAPVLLVLNAQGLSLSAAAIVQGFAGFQAELAEPQPDTLSSRIRGVVCNNV